MVKGAYIHIPFCEHICYYCDFNKFLIQYQPVDDFLNALASEIENTIRVYNDTALETIYIGGGTPSALSAPQLKKLVDIISDQLVTPSLQEYTVEVNPENLTEEKLKILKKAGVNRLSVGVQTFDDSLLPAIGRVHSVNEAIQGFNTARSLGFDNISVDLMFGLPGQTAESLVHSVETALQLDPEHVSIYSLQIEPKTIFYNRHKKGTLRHLPSQDLEADMYETIIDRLEKASLKQYEVSNFGKSGYESQHNLLYWKNESYFGFGAGAHGYVDGERTVNAGPIKTYLRLIKENGVSIMHKQPVSISEMMEEEMFLGLRVKTGVDKDRFEQKYGKTLRDVYGQEINDLKARGLMVENESCVALTEDGLFLGNEVFQAFLA